MAVSATSQHSLAELGAPPRGRLRAGVATARNQPLATFGLVVILALVAVAVVGPYFLPKDPYKTSVLQALKQPSSANWFGTDNLGRDIFSRVILATKYSLLIGLGATLISGVVSVGLGLLSVSSKAGVDLVIQRIVDAFMAIPFILFLLLVVTFIGPSFITIAVLIGIVSGVPNSRIVRSDALRVQSEMYVEAARSMGATPLRIAIYHVLPNIMATIIILTSVSLAGAILAESALSFLGYGVPPPDPTWGQMMGIQARAYLIRAPWMAVFPGIALSLAVFSVNVLGDGLRDVLDPRLRGR